MAGINEGKLVIFSAPSGAGKTTMVRKLLQSGLNLEFSVSAASREKRPNEKNGKDYYFLSADEFREKIHNNEFLEWEEVYKDHFYGTLKSEVQRIWELKKHVIFDVDVVGGLNIKKQYKEKALAIFVMPPSLDELEKRLRSRSTENEESLAKRMSKAKYEIAYADQFDRIIVNDNLDKSTSEAIHIVTEFLK